MSSYQQLAGAYDELTWDVGYEKRADFLEKLFRRSRIPVHTVLDLACGTGSMTWLLAGRGYELIAVDGSQEMLAAAREKSARRRYRPCSCTSPCPGWTCTAPWTPPSAAWTA